MNAKQIIAVVALTAAAVTSQHAPAQYETQRFNLELIDRLIQAYENKDYEKVKKIKGIILRHSDEKKKLNEKQIKEMKALMNNEAQK